MLVDKKVLSELKALADAKQLEPQYVLEAAKAPESALHQHFEWDDTKAAHSHRLGQAMNLIRVVRIQIVPRETPTHYDVPVRSIQQPTQRQVRLEARSKTKLDVALMDFQRLQEQYAAVPELQPVFRALRELKAKLSGMAAPPPRELPVAPTTNYRDIDAAVEFALALERKGLDRQSAVARAASVYPVQKSEIIELLRAAV